MASEGHAGLVVAAAAVVGLVALGSGEGTLVVVVMVVVAMVREQVKQKSLVDWASITLPPP
jgi:hypothetical protein